MLVVLSTIEAGFALQDEKQYYPNSDNEPWHA